MFTIEKIYRNNKKKDGTPYSEGKTLLTVKDSKGRSIYDWATETNSHWIEGDTIEQGVKNSGKGNWVDYDNNVDVGQASSGISREEFEALDARVRKLEMTEAVGPELTLEEQPPF